MKEIGSIQALNLKRIEEVKDVEIKDNDEGIIYFSLCREALKAIANTKKDGEKRALLPAYSCQTVLDPFEQSGYDIELYSANRDMSIDTEDIVKKAREFKPTITVVHPYHGMDFSEKEIEALKLVKETGTEIVEDLTQALFSERKYDFVDYYVGSIRKWSSFVDGGFLKSNKKVEKPTEIFKEYFETRKMAMELKDKYLKYGDIEIGEIAKKVTNESDEISEWKIVPHKMSELSRKLYATDNFEKIKAKRYENYTYLFKKISKLDSEKIRPIIGNNLDRLTTAPLFFPMYVKDRDNLWDYMIENEIYALKLWKGHKKEVEINDDVKCLFLNTIVVHCDHRYTKKDMARVVKVIKKFLNK